MSKIRVAILMGGVSSEHDISMKTGQMIAGSLDRERYDVEQVTINKDGQWKLPGKAAQPIGPALAAFQGLDVDCVFVALHGPFGEDGRIQGLLDVLAIPYTGSGCAASAIAMDKVRSKDLVEHAGVKVADQLVVTRDEWGADPQAVQNDVAARFGFPTVIKSPCQGSSLGMAIVREADDFQEAATDVFGYDDFLMIEAFLDGTEVTCGVLDVGSEPARALPVTEICPVSSPYFDYHAKYTPGACEEITPARISDDLTQQVQDMALRVHKVVGCRGLSRSDMIIVDGEPVWIEVNTIPGMTETSLFPQAAAAVGIAFSQLIEMLIDDALNRDRT
jgi:D-alanine-D-alanine ligase